MLDPVTAKRAAGQALVDEMMQQATLEHFRAQAVTLTLSDTLHGPILPELPEVAARVRFRGSDGAGVLVLGCDADFALGAAHANPPLQGWVLDHARQLAGRIEKRLRQFGVALQLEVLEPMGTVLPASEAPSGRSTSYWFGAASGRVCVQLDAELDLERIASVGQVPLRDEGDIILF
jgi:hypothetical protein